MLTLGDKIIAGSFKTGASWEVGDVGISAFGIDEALNKRRYLNGQVISQAQFVEFTAMLKSRASVYPNLSTTEVNWQAEVTNSALGQCGKFVIDDNAGTIRLPKVVNIQGLMDLTGLGGIKAESLPNIKSEDHAGFYYNGDNYTDALSVTKVGSESNGGSSSTWKRTTVKLDASRSSSTYQDDAPVQQEAVQYPYFIQVATGVETSVDVSEQIKLNLPFSLLDYKYSEYEISNASWLISNGQYNSGATYPAVYELLLQIYNGTVTKAGVSVKLSTEAYTDTDFVLNTGDTTFRLPIKVKLPNSKGVAGNGIKVGIRISNEAEDRYLMNTNRIQNGVCISGNQSASTDFSISQDTTKSGVEVKDDSSMYLYFYVGETVQDANIIAASNALTDIANLKSATNFSDAGKSTIAGLAMPSNTYDDLTLGVSGTEYTAPANGWFCINYNMTSNSSFAGLNIDGYAFVINGTTQYNAPFMFPCKKGGKIKLNYANAVVSLFRFYYAQGEV